STGSLLPALTRFRQLYPPQWLDLCKRHEGYFLNSRPTGDLMLDPRIQKLADVLIRHSARVRPGDKALVEAFDIPPEATACIVRSLAAAGALPVVETRHNQVLRELYRNATEEQMRLIGG